MSRLKTAVLYALSAIAIAALFGLFVTFRNDAALIGALSAAGTVAATGFAAIAALASVRAASESSAAAQRAREASARAGRPSLRVRTETTDGTLQGVVECGKDRGAVDVTIVWTLTNDETLVFQHAHLAAGAIVTNVLGAEASTCWVEYWDESRAGRWRDTWQGQPLTLADSAMD